MTPATLEGGSSVAQPLPLQPSVTFGAAGNGCEVVVTRSSVAQAEPPQSATSATRRPLVAGPWHHPPLRVTEESWPADLLSGNAVARFGRPEIPARRDDAKDRVG